MERGEAALRFYFTRCFSASLPMPEGIVQTNPYTYFPDCKSRAQNIMHHKEVDGAFVGTAGVIMLGRK